MVGDNERRFRAGRKIVSEWRGFCSHRRDVLLLDEPTNHLDVNAVEWLEDFLQDYDKTYVVISHDRYFLDRTTNRIIEIDRGQAVTYKGNYSEYLDRARASPRTAAAANTKISSR